MKGHIKIVEMLLQRGARVNVTNRGDDTPLHLAAAFGHKDIVLMVTDKYSIKSFLHISTFSFYAIELMSILLMNMAILLCIMLVFGIMTV